MSDLLSGLNPIQQQAVECTDGPSLILAGAGSGKTRVLTHKIAYLIHSGVLPENILAVTFTNKAAQEMKERLQVLLKDKGATAPPWTGTFHSICAKILRRHIHHLGYSPNFAIYDTGDQTDVIKQAMDQLRIKAKEDKINPNAVRAKISDCKSHLVSAEEYPRFAYDYFEKKVAQIYPIYQQKLRDNNAVDFDDLLNLTIDLFIQSPNVLLQYQDLFQYIFIDEYQDTNEAQYKLIKLLAAKHQNLTVVGDMSQSIYSFRGATIQNIINFEKDYAEARVFHLEQNYRSTQNILSAATHIILPNQKSHTILKLWTENGTGDPIQQYEALDEQDEANYVARRIQELADQDSIELSEMAILYRTNAQSRVLEEALLRYSIPYKLVGGTRFYDRKEIKDVLAYLRLSTNPEDSVAFNRVANVPARGIGPATLRDGGPKLDAFKRELEVYQKAAQELNILDLLDFILQHTGYRKYLDDGSEESEARWENVQELRTVAAQFATSGPQQSLQDFLENVALVESESRSENAKHSSNGEVTLMTLHAAKGLEFSVVFIVGLEEGIFPHSRAVLDPGEMQEERRLAYVGVTRAKELLHLIHAQQRVLFGSRSSNQVSRFIVDIPEDIMQVDGTNTFRSHTPAYPSRFAPQSAPPRNTIQFQPGDKVIHSVFGNGRVTEVATGLIAIDFEEVGLKKLDPDFARLIKVND